MEPAAREMLARDVESHAMALSGCERAFREANLKCILDMDRRNKAELLGGGTAVTSEVQWISHIWTQIVISLTLYVFVCILAVRTRRNRH